MHGFIGNTRGRNPLVSILIFVLFIVMTFYIARWIYFFLLWASPIIIILTALIDHKVFVDFGNRLWKTFQRSPLSGVLLSAAYIIAFPLVSVYLLAKAFLNRKLKNAQSGFARRKEDEFADYEILDEDPPLEFPDLEKKSNEDFL